MVVALRLFKIFLYLFIKQNLDCVYDKSGEEALLIFFTWRTSLLSQNSLSGFDI